MPGVGAAAAAGVDVMTLLKAIWRLAGSIHLTLGIIGLMVADLVWGYVMLRSHNELFTPINDRGFMEWAGTWARESPVPSLWLFILVGLIAVLALNTFVCTTDRVMTLFKFRKSFKNTWRFFLRFGPHIMHYGMLVMFLGYLFSYLFSGTHLGQVLVEGKSIEVGETRIALEGIHMAYYEGRRMPHLKDRVVYVAAVLYFQEGDRAATRMLAFNRPAVFNGISIHLRDFRPRVKNSSMGSGRRYLQVTVKKDPGIKFYFTGMLLFVFGLLIYTAEKLSARHPAKQAHGADREETWEKNISAEPQS